MQAAGELGYVLDAWFGHSAVIEAKHYLMVTEADFARAVVPSVVPSQGNPVPRQSIEAQKKPGKTGVGRADEGVGWADEYTRQDSNLQPSVPKTDALSNCATGAWLKLYRGDPDC